MTRVEVYWNLHKHCYSVRALAGENKGRVFLHTNHLTLSNVDFVVQPAGRAKVLRDKVKNVHAFVRGTLHAVMPQTDKVRVTYNPYKGDSFVALKDGERVPIHKADFVELDSAPVGPFSDGVIGPFMYAR